VDPLAEGVPPTPPVLALGDALPPLEFDPV